MDFLEMAKQAALKLGGHNDSPVKAGIFALIAMADDSRHMRESIDANNERQRYVNDQMLSHMEQMRERLGGIADKAPRGV